MKLVGILAALLLTIGAAVALGGSSGDHPAPVAIGDVRLVSVDGCDDLLAWYRTVAEQSDAAALTGYGYAAGGDVGFGVAGGKAVAPTTSAAGAARDSAEEAPTHSDTNVQERGVDEPDTVKTNGRIVVNAGADTLEIVDVTGDAPKLLSTMPLDQGGTELLLSGDRVLTLTNVWRPDPNATQPTGDQRIMLMPIQGKQVTVIRSIDVSDPAHPREVERRELAGSYRTARLTGTTARIVMVTNPQIPAPGPAVYGPTDGIEQQKLQQWKAEAIASMTLKDWAPLADRDCSSVARTSQPEGLATTSVLTLDAEGSLDILDTDSVVADAGTVYASPDRLFIATSRWSQDRNPGGQVRTELHGFDISGPQTSYVGSGSVPGYLLNQFALSASGGHLRVATTQEAPWDEQQPEAQSTHSSIAVLDERAGALVEVGRVDGLGVTERIQAVRYLGDLAYVVTFRQKDPLYVIDLSDPTAPRVAGQLKVPGYSAYLHPIDGDRLIGVGQDATDDGQVLGTQIATFDVHDPAAPGRIDALRIDHGSSSVEYDHRAFLWWDATRTVVLPVQIFDPGVVEPLPAPAPAEEPCAPDAPCSSPGSSGSGTSASGGVAAPPAARPFMGAVVYAVATDGTLTEVGRVSHDGRGEQADGYYPINRSLVIGDALYTVSDTGLLRSDLTSLADQGFVAFPLPADQGQPIPVEG